MKNKIILHLCADIGSDTLPYKEAGYDVRCIGKDIGVENYHPPENVYGIIANPPCTMFSCARTTAKTARDMKLGMFCVRECLRIIWECQYQTTKDVPHKLSFWVIENPATGYLKHYLGEPIYRYEQWEFGGEIRKRTALWGLFKHPEKMIKNMPEGVKGKTSDASWGRRKQGQGRSICFYGFAKAFFEANL